MNCKNCGSALDPNLSYCGFCGAPKTDNPSQSNAGYDPFANADTIQAGVNDLPMKWYKFIVKIALPISIVFGALSVISNIISVFTESSTLLGLINILIGFVSVFFAFNARKKLLGFMSDGPKMLYLCYGVSALSNLITMIIGLFINSALNFITLSALCASLIVLACNVSYFTKRRHMFWH